MTINEMNIIIEIKNITDSIQCKKDELINFVEEHNNEYWLHIDVIHNKIDEIYDNIMELVYDIRGLQETSTEMLDYEHMYAGAKVMLECINDVKELFNFE